MAMESDSDISCEDRIRNLEASEECLKQPQHQQACQSNSPSQIPSEKPWSSFEAAHERTQPRPALGVVGRALSSQVMEYYHKYRNSNLEQYFSLPTTSTASDALDDYYSIYDVSPKLDTSEEKADSADRNSGFKSFVDKKERRRWARPLSIGQCVNVDGTAAHSRPLTELRSPSPETKNATPVTIHEERIEVLDTEKKSLSPTLSTTSHRPLEWDSGADVGYFNTVPYHKHSSNKFSTIERMALRTGCSAALRLDPEGTTGTTEPGSLVQTGTSARPSARAQIRPDANSTPLLENVSGSESEVEITPIVKSHLPGVLNGSDMKSGERSRQGSKSVTPTLADETPKSCAFKVPRSISTKYATEGRSSSVKKSQCSGSTSSSPLKKSSSMNLLSSLGTEVGPKRSQSELNLCAKEKMKVLPRLIFNSTSSIATVVNKRVTCDKVIQTSVVSYSRESVGVQVSVLEEEKPPLPKRGTSLTQKSLQSILKNPKNTYRVQTDTKCGVSVQKTQKAEASRPSTSTSSPYESTPSLQDDPENVTGRANSFEYFPGHIYENVPNETPSHVSSVDTGRSNSTMPNTSSSIDEKLWGDSDSLVRDLERSVNILKSLVDANKCDKRVKKRLIHHVVKRLSSAKYTDDKIEHNLEENVPWNPDDARKKVYRAEIIHALTKKQNTTDSSDDWKPQRKKSVVKKSTESEARAVKEIINLESSSDKFDRNTDRTELDGRKARMGLRADHCRNSSNTPTDANKSESSECFLPQRNKMTNVFCLKKKCEVPCREHLMSKSTPSDENRVLLDTVVNGRESPVESSNEPDWKLPMTMSERQYELRRCSNTDSGDSKLVSYAEMEKKNQLMWINDVINHLSNLKNRLEQPKKLERSKSSPRKSRHSSYKPGSATVHTHEHHENGHLERTKREATDTMNYPISKQWSSHCNLPTYRQVASPKNARHVKKRNSYTQTGSRTEEAHSKSGAEIISALRLHGSSIKSTDIQVQTSPRRSSPSSRSLRRSPHFQPPCPCHENCKHVAEQTYHRTYHRHSKVYSHHVKTQTASSRSPEYSRYTDERPIISQPTTSSGACVCNMDNNAKQKETKNHLNSSKLKSSGDKCTCDNSKTQKVKGCESCSRNERSFESSGHFQSFKSCNCKHCVDNESDRRHRKQNTWECFSGNVHQSRNLSKNQNFGVKCSCGNDCSCANEIRASDDAETTKESHQCCRGCGVAYQRGRKCGCTVVSHPKAVAYELSFTSNKESSREMRSSKLESVNVKKSKDLDSRMGTYETRGSACSCEDDRSKKTVDNDQEKNTLRDYLISNKPASINNIETRRQYISEISQLRQLRKEKRIQLLAMSGTSNVISPPKSPQKTKCVQKKIREENMKKRLRQRYFRLNEVRAKRRQKEKDEEVRRNRLMARIFGKKLQQKVLKGEVDLSQSMSVISNL